MQIQALDVKYLSVSMMARLTCTSHAESFAEHLLLVLNDASKADSKSPTWKLIQVQVACHQRIAVSTLNLRSACLWHLYRMFMHVYRFISRQKQQEKHCGINPMKTHYCSMPFLPLNLALGFALIWLHKPLSVIAAWEFILVVLWQNHQPALHSMRFINQS